MPLILYSLLLASLLPSLFFPRCNNFLSENRLRLVFFFSLNSLKRKSFKKLKHAACYFLYLTPELRRQSWERERLRRGRGSGTSIIISFVSDWDESLRRLSELRAARKGGRLSSTGEPSSRGEGGCGAGRFLAESLSVSRSGG